jgi:hypothetical protein
MENKRPGIPAFLQKLDSYLLKNKPAIWSTRSHLVMYFGVVFTAVISMVCWLAFYNFKERSNAGVWAGFIGLISFIGFVFWLIFLLRFNVFKRFGNWKKLEGLQTFGLYFINIGIMVWLVFLPFVVECVKTNAQFTNNEISQDINELNTTVCRLEHALLQQQFNADTFKVVNNLRARTTETISVDAADVVSAATNAADDAINESNNQMYIPYNRLIDTAELRKKIENADSLIKLNDSIYIFYEAPTYQFVKNTTNDIYTSVKQLSNIQLYYTIVKNPPPLGDKNILLGRIKYFREKYFNDEGYHNYYKENKQYDDIINEKYDLPEIERGIDNIVEKKYWWAEGKAVYINIFLYTTFIITLLVFVFRHTTIKTFFLTILFAVVLLIISALFVEITNIRDVGISTIAILYYIVLAIVALCTNNFKTRTAINGIAINIFVFTTYFFPIVLTNFYFEVQRKIHENDLLHNYRYEEKEMAFLIAEIVGIILFICMIELVFRKLYKKWYSLPEA